jgi:hypothetical protein
MTDATLLLEKRLLMSGSKILTVKQTKKRSQRKERSEVLNPSKMIKFRSSLKLTK